MGWNEEYKSLTGPSFGYRKGGGGHGHRIASALVVSGVKDQVERGSGRKIADGEERGV